MTLATLEDEDGEEHTTEEGGVISVVETSAGGVPA